MDCPVQGNGSGSPEWPPCSGQRGFGRGHRDGTTHVIFEPLDFIAKLDDSPAASWDNSARLFAY